MSNQSYMKGCRDCGQQIRMDQVNGKWAAYELTGSGFHTCKQQQKKDEQTKTLTLEMMDIRLKRVESIVIGPMYEFIKNNPNRNQSDIVRGLKEVCTRLPVLDAIGELTSDKDGREPKVKFSINTPKGSYRYYVNDKNEYNLLEKRISELYQMAEELDEQVKMIKRSPDYLSMKKKGSQFGKFNLLVI